MVEFVNKADIPVTMDHITVFIGPLCQHGAKLMQIDEAMPHFY